MMDIKCITVQGVDIVVTEKTGRDRTPVDTLEKDGGASEEGEMSAGTQGEIRVGPSHQVCSIQLQQYPHNYLVGSLYLSSISIFLSWTEKKNLIYKI